MAVTLREPLLQHRTQTSGEWEQASYPESLVRVRLDKALTQIDPLTRVVTYFDFAKERRFNVSDTGGGELRCVITVSMQMLQIINALLPFEIMEG